MGVQRTRETPDWTNLLVEVRGWLLLAGGIIAVTVTLLLANREVTYHKAPPAYDPAPVGGIVAWRLGESGVVGWVQTEVGCPQAHAIVTTGQVSGDIYIGQIPKSQRTTWLGYVQDDHGRRTPLDASPGVTFYCFRG